jgi:8-oxo-dGTP pyrophosphatase MutT (NUDIX family)
MPGPLVLPAPRLRAWQTLRRESIASYRIFEVERLHLEDGGGRARGDAFTLRFPDWCNVIAITPEDELVLVWQFRFGTGALSLEIPGGVIDPGESPEQAARRELREETGYEPDRLELLVVVEANPAIQANRCFTFLAHGARATARTGFDAQEELETVLVPASRATDLLDGGQVTHSLVYSALETYGRKRSASARPR